MSIGNTSTETTIYEMYICERLQIYKRAIDNIRNGDYSYKHKLNNFKLSRKAEGRCPWRSELYIFATLRKTVVVPRRIA
nr:MAG TPA: hypothetical protein [Caudoviricetes sp.]